jgi:hypothetical protein
MREGGGLGPAGFVCYALDPTRLTYVVGGKSHVKPSFTGKVTSLMRKSHENIGSP